MLTFLAFYPYVIAILKDETKPYVFSWLIWAAGTVIVFAAQLLDGGGYGAWVIGISGVISFGIAALTWRKSTDLSISRIDWLFLALAGSALPLWARCAMPSFCRR